MKEEIGKRLRKLRTEKGLTQKELAARVSGGLDYTYIGKIERGDQLPSLKILGRIADTLGVPIGYFFREEKEALAGILSAELRPLLASDAGRELAQALRALHPDDLPLLTEIVKVLNRHRTADLAAREQGAYPRAAEEEDPYRKREK